MSGYKVVRRRFQSGALEGNPLGDPADREVPVLLPPGYEEDPEGSWPVIFVLAGFLGSGHNHLNWSLFDESLDQRLSRLHEEARLTPCIFVLPDCSTSLGGSQYRNSSAVGNYADYVCEELVPWVDETFRTRKGRRGLAGKSSGGYAAFMLGMERPDLFSAVACHSGDAYFEYCYKRDLPIAADRLARDGGVEEFLDSFRAKPKRTGEDFHVLNIVAMSACYSPDPEEPAGIALPFELPTGRLRPEVWERWLRHDPVEIVKEGAEALRDLDFLFLDCGSRDEYYLHLGMRILSQELGSLGIEHRVEEFEDDHRGISYRFDVSLPPMAKALTSQGR